MRLFALYVLTDIFITVYAWTCLSPVSKSFGLVNSTANFKFSADLTSLPNEFEVKFYDNSIMARIIYNEDRSSTTEALPGVSITGDTAGNVAVILNDVQQNNAGVYILTSAGVATKCNCLYILDHPLKPNITLSQIPFVGENVIFTCDSASNTIPRNHSLTLLYTWMIDGIKDPSDSRYSYTSNKKTFTITHIVKDDKTKRVSCSAIEDSSFNFSSQMSDTFPFDVYYGPDVAKIDVDSPYYSTEGETNKQIRCTSVCHPNCTFHWTHAESGLPAGTSGLLSFNPINRNDAGEYRCTARNTADSTGKYEYANLHLVVQYPPTVSIRSSTEVIREGHELTLYCEGEGVPSTNVYTSFTQIFNNVEIPNNNSPIGTERFSKITFTPLFLQDTGTYTCTLNNGIRNTKGELDQSGSKEIIVEAYPKILTDELRFTGSAQGVGHIYVSIYSHPTLDHVAVLRPNGTGISADTFTVTKNIVQTSFYGKEVTLNGSVFDLKIRDLKEDDFGNYTLKLTNKLGTTTRIASFIAEGRPSSPTFFQYLPGKTLPTFLWKKNFNGGLIQSFIIQISINGTNIWKNMTNISESDVQYQINGSYFLIEVHGLRPGIFTARLISKNSKGESDIVELGSTFEVFKQTENQKAIAVIVGVIVCAVVVVLIGIVVIVVIRRAKNKGDRETKFSQNAEHDQDNEEDSEGKYLLAQI